jgi:aerobic carbon-monoxide dehydrogenase medium subunit
MKPAPFKYIVARSLDEALTAKAEYGEEARFLAGGQSLVPTMNFRLSQPAVLIDINFLAELSGVRDGEGTHIGAMTRYRMLECDPLVAASQPILLEALPHIAHPQIRNRGTLGGNLAHADPASEMPAIVLALEGTLHVRSGAGDRPIAADAFFVAALETALRPDEMLVEIVLPKLPPRTGVCFMEVARRSGDFAMAGVAAIVTLDDDGLCRGARLAFCGVAERPWHADKAAGSLIGAAPGESAFQQAAELAMQGMTPVGSIHASGGYQRHLAGVLTRRALAVAAVRAQQDSRGHRGH